jgi:myo-inositol-1(or 4)-monophosphatase
MSDNVGSGQSVFSERELLELERTAVELANLAGAEIVTALGGMLSVRYKTGSDAEEIWEDPVSEIDHRVEVLIRARLADRFPEHDIIGEEINERPGRDHDFAWVIDPIDGTTNFVNGFPLFAASVGVLHLGTPIVGAVWCSTSHRLRAGIYHARRGGGLCFDERPVEPRPNPAVRRGLAGVPTSRLDDGPWETRKTGSAAVECALVAAGLLRVARFEHPNLWDVAGGVALVQAAGGEARTACATGWTLLERFEGSAELAGVKPDLRNWRRPLIVGDRAAVTRMSGLHSV